MQENPLQVLNRYWGHSAFRHNQAEIIDRVLGGSDVLALLPTGGGKSVCYQVPALCKAGVCLVISPLIALMKDQVRQLVERGIPAAAIYAGMHPRLIDETFDQACVGHYKFLYLSPERLLSAMARARIPRMSVNLLAVDEAHCISQWGYDFRPPYLRIAELRELLPGVPVLALTATATGVVVEDIQEKLAFRQSCVMRQSFARPNLSYSVLYENRKREKLAAMFRSVHGSGIVYVRSRGETREVSEFLVEQGIQATYYHAGLSMEDRHLRQDAWISGKVRVMVATNAFGMGIDKPDVRLVVHLQMPDTLEAYFQEAGRAGRDGNKAYAVVLFDPADTVHLRHLLETAYPGLGMVRTVYHQLGSYLQLALGSGAGESFDFDFIDFCNRYQLGVGSAFSSLRLLQQEGWISISEGIQAPASVCFRVTREVLYDYQIRNKQADGVVKVLLRAHPGIHSNWCDISEQMLARRANLPLEQVVRVLQLAQQEEILYYQPRREKPQLQFLRDRVSGSELLLDHRRFEHRRRAASERLEAAIGYVSNGVCRSIQLLRYFGEDTYTPCGICDICTGRHERNPGRQEYHLLAERVRLVLGSGMVGVHALVEAFPPQQRELVTTVIQYLMDEGKLVSEGGGLRWA
jgi:ATP-dependent DNA helicase RecQ